jgi:hypothetical protein
VRWPAKVHHRWFPSVQTVTEMTANFCAAAVMMPVMPRAVRARVSAAAQIGLDRLSGRGCSLLVFLAHGLFRLHVAFATEQQGTGIAREISNRLKVTGAG